MQAEHLKGWLAASNRGKLAVEKGEGKTEEEEEGGELWEKLVDLVQTAFREGEMAEEATWQTVVLIPKGRKEYMGYWASGGDVEGCGGDLTSPAHDRHHLS